MHQTKVDRRRIWRRWGGKLNNLNKYNILGNFEEGSYWKQIKKELDFEQIMWQNGSITPFFKWFVTCQLWFLSIRKYLREILNPNLREKNQILIINSCNNIKSATTSHPHMMNDLNPKRCVFIPPLFFQYIFTFPLYRLSPASIFFFLCALKVRFL